MNEWRTKLFEISWRLTFFLLPWQTRWFEPATLGGWSWEQGSLAVYAVWLPLFATLLLGFQMKRVRQLILPGILLASAAAVGLASQAPFEPMLQWWAQIILLILFIWTLWGRIDRYAALSWFVLSLVPVALLGAYQFALQKAPGFSWLGLAAHDPRELGVSVVEWSEFRLLRAYGSFPHPNIFGAWLSAGTLSAVWAAALSKDKYRAIAFAFAAALFSGLLILTFSRSAMLAVILGLVPLCIEIFRRRASGLSVNFAGLATACAVLAALVMGMAQLEPLTARAKAQGRLENISTSERREGYSAGWELLKAHPLRGTGANAELAVMLPSAQKNQRGELRAPLESPHNFFLLLFLNLGLLGGLFFLLFCAHALKRLAPALLVFAWFLPLAFLDHYFWSYWAGQALLILVLFMFARLAVDKKPNFT